MATFDDYIQSLTLHSLAPNVYDGVLSGNFLTHRIMNNAKTWSGESMKFAFMYRKNTSSKWYDGMDTLNTSRVNTRIRLSFEPRWFSQSVVIAGTDLDVNSTREGIIKLLGAEMETAQQSMVDSLGTDFYSLQNGKKMQGIENISDDGTQTTTYGGQTRSTYTAINGQTNASGGTLTVSLMGTLEDDCSAGNIGPNLGVCTKPVFTIYEGLLQPTVRMNLDISGYSQATKDGSVSSRKGLGGDIGFDQLWYRGMPMVKDEKCTSQAMYMLNEDYLAWYSLASSRWSQVPMGSSVIDGPYAKGPNKALKLYWSGLKEPTAQDAEVGFFKIGGNLISTNPRFQGVLTGITA